MIRHITLAACVTIHALVVGQAANVVAQEFHESPSELALPMRGPERDVERPAEKIGHAALRLSLQLFAGAATTAMTTGVGLLIGGSVGSECEGFVCVPTGALVGATAGYLLQPFTTGAVVWQIGETMNQTGEFWPTAGGVFVGSLVGALVVGALADSDSDELSAVGAVSWLFLPTIGGLVGYELSSESRDDNGQRPTAFALQPVVALEPRSGYGGVAGRF